MRPIGVIFLFLSWAAAFAQGSSVVDLRVEYDTDPLGIDVAQPRLFWRMESSEPGQRQTAWQVLVASNPEHLRRETGDLWDSGKVETDESTHIRYEGRALESSRQVFWKVRAWDRHGNALDWSEPATWTMGLLEPDQWQARWIQAPERYESTLLRRALEVRAGLERALIHVSGLGHYELFVNGRKVSEDLLTPGWTNYDVSTLYDTRDITDHLEEGANALGAVLGNGMFHVERKERFTKFIGSFGQQRLIAHLRLEYSDGSVEIVGTDTDWKTHPGPLTYSNIYGGEDHDARRLPPGWASPDFDDVGWQQAVIAEGGSLETLRGHRASVEPIRAIESRRPVRTIPLGADGGITFDFGQNASFMPRLRISGPAGSRVRMVPGELIYDDGYVTRSSMGGVHRFSSWWEYTKATDEVEEWFPQFFYIGSRYLQTQAFPAEAGGALPRIESVEQVIVQASAAAVGDFSTSNPLINDIRGLVRWAQRSNMVSVLTDCPHREKLGWLEQYHLNGPAIRYEFDLARMFTKAMQDMADSQTAEGLVPNIAPEFTEFAGSFRAAAEWGAAFIAVPWQQYQFHGDTALMERHYDAMKRYFSYLEERAEDGILSEGLGDWHDLGPRRISRSELTLPPLTATAFLYQNAVMLTEMATILGHETDARRFSEAGRRTRERFNATFYNAEGGYYGENSQAANAIPLVMGLVEESERARVFAALLADIEAQDYAVTAGDVGHRYLLRALAEGGRSDVIYRIINQDEKPGYGYQLKMGATSLPEAWDARGSASQNHFMLGHINEWFYRDLLGIRPDPERPGFRSILIQPEPVPGLEWAEGGYDSLHGRITVRWEQVESRFDLRLTIPANTTATVFLPTAPGAELSVNGDAADHAAGVAFLREEGGRSVYSVESGTYAFAVSDSGLSSPSRYDTSWLPANFPVPTTAGPTLMPRNYLTPEQAARVHEAALEAFPDRESWDEYAGHLRVRIRQAAKLDPWPERTPLNPIIRNRRVHDGYSVENIAIETVPGYWATGNLYRPLDARPPYAAVLNTHGHSGGVDGPDGWLAHGRFKPDVQARAAAIARMGGVALTLDMFGYGDQRAQLGPDAHRTPDAMTLQLWNNIRALDFLSTLEGVDPARIAVTGHSGGGTQAFLLSALDERVAVNVPVAMVSGWFFGGCPCESGLPIHRGADHFANNAMITALSAPRPLLVVSVGGDWSAHTPEIEFPFIEQVYGYYGANDNAVNAHLPEEGHNYGPAKRAALYPFLAQHLGLDLSAVRGSDGAVDESALTVEDERQMRVFDETHPLPSHALPDAVAIMNALRSLQAPSR